MSFEFADVPTLPPAGQVPDASALLMDSASLSGTATVEPHLSIPPSSGPDDLPLLTEETGADQSLDLLLANADGSSALLADDGDTGSGSRPGITLLDSSVEELDPIVIVGTRHKDDGGGASYNNGGFWYTFSGGGASGGGGGGDDGGTGEVATPVDAAVIEVAVNFTPTPEQQAVIDRFKEAVADSVEAVNALPDDAKLTLENGSTVSGAELKAIVANMDFVINSPQTAYQNGTTRGEADYNGGNPQVSINVDVLQAFDAHAGGLVFAALHEVGHMVAASRNFNVSIQHNGVTTQETEDLEEMASDIARAVAAHAGISTLEGGAEPGYGYSTSSPMTFSAADGGSGSGSGGTGGGFGEHVSY